MFGFTEHGLITWEVQSHRLTGSPLADANAYAGADMKCLARNGHCT